MSKATRLADLVAIHEAFFDDLCRTTASPIVRAWIHDEWDPWFSRWSAATADGDITPSLVREASQGLSQLREHARTQGVTVPDIGSTQPTTPAHVIDPVVAQMDHETNERFWQTTGYKPGQRLDSHDPADAAMIPTWLSIRYQVAQDTNRASQPHAIASVSGAPSGAVHGGGGARAEYARPAPEYARPQRPERVEPVARGERFAEPVRPRAPIDYRQPAVYAPAPGYEHEYDHVGRHGYGGFYRHGSAYPGRWWRSAAGVPVWVESDVNMLTFGDPGATNDPELDALPPPTVDQVPIHPEAQGTPPPGAVPDPGDQGDQGDQDPNAAGPDDGTDAQPDAVSSGHGHGHGGRGRRGGWGGGWGGYGWDGYGYGDDGDVTIENTINVNGNEPSDAQVGWDLFHTIDNVAHAAVSDLDPRNAYKDLDPRRSFGRLNEDGRPGRDGRHHGPTMWGHHHNRRGARFERDGRD